MTNVNLVKIIGYTVSVVMIVLGVAVLTGLIHVRSGSTGRLVFGIILLLYAGYRLAVLRLKPRQPRTGRTHGPLLLLLIACLSSCNRPKTVEDTPISGTLQIAVSESHATLVQAEADQFMRLYTDAKITVLAVPTREAVVHLLNDSVPCAALDRPFNAEEEKIASQSKTRCDSVFIAKDAIAVVVNLFNNMQQISFEGLRSILAGRISDWTRLSDSGLSGPIQIVLTGINSGAYELLRTRFSLLPDGFIPSIQTPTQNDVVRTVSGRLGAIGFVSLACLKDTSALRIEKEKVRALDFIGVDSTGSRTRQRLHQANVYLGKYPLHFPVVMYVRSAESKLAVGFSGFVAATQGQQLILNRGLVPATTPVRLVQLTSGSPE